jgi:hypothetical protein
MTTATTYAPSSTPATDVLVLIQRLSSLRSMADESMRSSALNIAKARRSSSYQTSCVGGGSVYSVDSVREELRARALLGWRKGGGKGKEENGDDDEDVEPHLAKEDDDIDSDVARYCEDVNGRMVADGYGSGGGNFVLHLDGMEGLRRRQQRIGGREELVDDNIAKGGELRGDVGLRRRRVPTGEEERTKNDDDDDDAAAAAAARAGGGVVEWTSEENLADEEWHEMERRLRDADPLSLFGLPPPALRAAQASSRDALAYYVEMANMAMNIQSIMNEESR